MTEHSDGGPHDNTNGEAPDRRVELDAAVVRSLARLTGGEMLAFVETDEPARDWLDWLAGAPLPQVNGVLIHVLRRWHELRSKR